MNQVKKFIDSESLKKLYFSMVHLKLSYAVNVYGCASKTNLEKPCNQTKASNSNH